MSEPALGVIDRDTRDALDEHYKAIARICSDRGLLRQAWRVELPGGYVCKFKVSAFLKGPAAPPAAADHEAWARALVPIIDWVCPSCRVVNLPDCSICRSCSFVRSIGGDD